jgi:hypothetical protein
VADEKDIIAGIAFQVSLEGADKVEQQVAALPEKLRGKAKVKLGVSLDPAAVAETKAKLAELQAFEQKLVDMAFGGGGGGGGSRGGGGSSRGRQAGTKLSLGMKGWTDEMIRALEDPFIEAMTKVSKSGEEKVGKLKFMSGDAGNSFKMSAESSKQASEAFAELMAQRGAGLAGSTKLQATLPAGSDLSKIYAVAAENDATVRAKLEQEKAAAKAASGSKSYKSAKTDDELALEKKEKEIHSAKVNWMSKGLSAQEALNRSLKDYEDKAKKAVEPTSWIAKAWDTIGAGGIRRGVAQLTTGGLEGMLGEGSKVAAAGGAMTGALVSSLALPIAWAVGNAIAKIPSQIGAAVDWRRENQELSARAGGGLAGEEWKQQAGLLKASVGYLYGDKGTAMYSDIDKMMAVYQTTGAMNPNQIEEARQAANASFTAALLNAAKLEQSPLTLIEQIKRATTGTGEERQGAMQELGNRYYIHEGLVKEALRGRSGVGAEILAEGEVKARLGYFPGMPGAYDVNHLLFIAEEQAKKDARVKGIFEKQMGEFHSGGSGGFFPSLDANTLPANERGWITGRREELKKYGPGGLYGPGGRFESWGKGGVPEPKTTLRNDANAQIYTIQEDRIAVLEAIARGQVTPAAGGGIGKFPFGTEDVKTRGGMPAEYNWTSFSGMAEQMQMMWSGAPIDNNTMAMQENTTALKENTVALAGGGGGSHYVPTPGTPMK